MENFVILKCKKYGNRLEDQEHKWTHEDLKSIDIHIWRQHNKSKPVTFYLILIMGSTELNSLCNPLYTSGYTSGYVADIHCMRHNYKSSPKGNSFIEWLGGLSWGFSVEQTLKFHSMSPGGYLHKAFSTIPRILPPFNYDNIMSTNMSASFICDCPFSLLTDTKMLSYFYLSQTLQKSLVFSAIFPSLNLF